MFKYVKKEKFQGQKNVLTNSAGTVFYVEEGTNDKELFERYPHMFDKEEKKVIKPKTPMTPKKDKLVSDVEEKLKACSSMSDIKKLAVECNIDLDPKLNNFNKIKKDFKSKM